MDTLEKNDRKQTPSFELVTSAMNKTNSDVTETEGVFWGQLEAGWCQEASLRKRHLIQEQNESFMQISKGKVLQADERANAKPQR